MLARFGTAIIGIPVILGLLYLGGLWWAATIAFLTILAAREMVGLIRKVSESNALSTLPIAFGGVFFAFSAYAFEWSAPVLWVPAIIAVFLVACVSELVRLDRAPTRAVGATLLGVVYPGLLFAHLVLLRLLPDGLLLTLLLILGTWASDSAAFFVGRSLGKHKLLPSVSPNKTREGAIGGVLGGIAMGLLLTGSMGIPLWLSGFLGALVSVAGQVGDLSASALKREAGLKDTGTLLPGHGGVIDRFDSLLFAGTVLYYTLPLFRGWPMG